VKNKYLIKNPYSIAINCSTWLKWYLYSKISGCYLLTNDVDVCEDYKL